MEVAVAFKEKTQVLSLLIERVQFDIDDSSIAITLHPSGIRALSQASPDPEESATP